MVYHEQLLPGQEGFWVDTATVADVGVTAYLCDFTLIMAFQSHYVPIFQAAKERLLSKP